MSYLIRFLFPVQPDKRFSALVLALRVLFGGLLLSHGLQKWAAFSDLAPVFPDPLGIGSSASLTLAVFGEAVCSVAFVFGFLYRLALLPMIFTMSVAFFVVHGADPFAVKELAFVYLAVFVVLYVAGPGRYSVDYVIGKKMER